MVQTRTPEVISGAFYFRTWNVQGITEGVGVLTIACVKAVTPQHTIYHPRTRNVRGWQKRRLGTARAI